MINSMLESINKDMILHFKYPILIVILNIFFIIATYTDIKELKIYNSLNKAMLFTRAYSIYCIGIINSQLSLNIKIALLLIISLIGIFLFKKSKLKVRNMDALSSITIILIIIPFLTIDLTYLIGGILMLAMFLTVAILLKANIAGDIKFATNIGFWLGAPSSLFLILNTLLVNIIVRTIKKNKNRTPLAPYFYIGYIILLIITLKYPF